MHLSASSQKTNLMMFWKSNYVKKNQPFPSSYHTYTLLWKSTKHFAVRCLKLIAVLLYCISKTEAFDLTYSPSPWAAEGQWRPGIQPSETSSLGLEGIHRFSSPGEIDNEWILLKANLWLQVREPLWDQSRFSIDFKCTIYFLEYNHCY